MSFHENGRFSYTWLGGADVSYYNLKRGVSSKVQVIKQCIINLTRQQSKQAEVLSLQKTLRFFQCEGLKQSSSTF